MSTIAIQFLAKKITANCLEQAENQHKCYKKSNNDHPNCIFSSCSPDLQWVEGSLKSFGFQRHNKYNLRMCKNQKYVSPVVQSSD